jgi:hypothetical protein
MATFFKSSRVWVMDFTYEGRPRRWTKALPETQDGRAVLPAQLRDLYGDHAHVVDVRPATLEEETQYIHGTEPKNVFCPTGRREGS